MSCYLCLNERRRGPTQRTIETRQRRGRGDDSNSSTTKHNSSHSRRPPRITQHDTDSLAQSTKAKLECPPEQSTETCTQHSPLRPLRLSHLPNLCPAGLLDPLSTSRFLSPFSESTPRTALLTTLVPPRPHTHINRHVERGRAADWRAGRRRGDGAERAGEAEREQQEDAAALAPQSPAAVSKPAEPTEEELGRRAEEAAAAEEAREQAELKAQQDAQTAKEAAAAKLAADIARRRRVDAEELQLVEAASAPLRAWLLANVLPAVIDGLQQTVKERPEDPVDFLATFLYKYALDSGELERAPAQAAVDTTSSTITV